MELAVPNPKHPSGRIDVAEREPHDLAAAQPRGVQQHHGAAHDLPMQARAATPSPPRGASREELRDLATRDDPRQRIGLELHERMRIRQKAAELGAPPMPAELMEDPLPPQPRTDTQVRAAVPPPIEQRAGQVI